MLAIVLGKVLKNSGGKLSGPLALFDFKCLIMIFISFQVGAPEGIFVVSDVICVVVVQRCWEGAARLSLKYSCHLINWFCGVTRKRPVVSLMPAWLNVKGFLASRFVI